MLKEKEEDELEQFLKECDKLLAYTREIQDLANELVKKVETKVYRETGISNIEGYVNSELNHFSFAINAARLLGIDTREYNKKYEELLTKYGFKGIEIHVEVPIDAIINRKYKDKKRGPEDITIH